MHHYVGEVGTRWRACVHGSQQLTSLSFWKAEKWVKNMWYKAEACPTAYWDLHSTALLATPGPSAGLPAGRSPQLAYTWAAKPAALMRAAPLCLHCSSSAAVAPSAPLGLADGKWNRAG